MKTIWIFSVSLILCKFSYAYAAPSFEGEDFPTEESALTLRETNAFSTEQAANENQEDLDLREFARLDPDTAAYTVGFLNARFLAKLRKNPGFNEVFSS